MDESVLLLQKPNFSDGRLTNTTVTQELVAITELTEELLVEEIPELLRRDLAFSAIWADSRYDDSEVGQTNAKAVGDFVLLRVLSVNAAGEMNQDLKGVKRSFAINCASGLIVGSEQYYGATDFLDTFWAKDRKSI